MTITEMITELRETESVDLLSTLDDLVEEYKMQQQEQQVEAQV